jgi:hypothetical protein
VAVSPRQVERKLVPADQWDAFVERHEDGWFFHSSRWIDYSLAYTPGAQDLSYALVDDRDHVLLALVPAVLGPDAMPVYGGQPLAAPIFEADLSGCHTHVEKPCTVIARPGREVETVADSTDVQAVQWDTHVVDLSRSEAELWSDLRRSYHSLINKARRTYKLCTFGGGVEAMWPIERARAIHVTKAGRETRPSSTWSMMGRWMRDGHGVLAMAQDDAGASGYAYAIRYKDWSYYASGASYAPNLQHALVWELIRTLRNDGRTRYFEVGWGPREGDTEKDLGIATFKAGFGGRRWTVHGLTRKAA